MANAKAGSKAGAVEEYIAGQPDEAQAALKKVRAAIRKAIPKVTEGISYKMLAFKLGDEPVVHVAAWKKHYAVYAATKGVVTAFETELAPYEVIKGTIRFPLAEPVPVGLIEKIVKFRAKEVMGGIRRKNE